MTPDEFYRRERAADRRHLLRLLAMLIVFAGLVIGATEASRACWTRTTAHAVEWRAEPRAPR